MTGEPRIFNPGDQFRQHHYVVERFLGEGGSGQVYAVEHRFTHMVVALKVSHLADCGDARKVMRSLQQAQLSFRIRHDNVVQVIDIGCEDDGLVWQLMELLEGHTLAALLYRVGRLSPVYAIDVVLEAAYGLQAAHELGVVHRDVQPSNLFLTLSGRVKVLDFSLSSWVHSQLKTTHGRGPKGSLGYMSPEHIWKAEPTPGFDVYALGMVLWQLLVGRHPFQESLGNAITLVDRQLHDVPASLVGAAGLPAYCDEVVRCATAKDPAARYRGMWPLVQALMGLRERLLSDRSLPDRVRHGEAWERALPIVRSTESAPRYASAPAPKAAEAPHIPSGRVYVAQTVPMAAVPEKAEARLDRTPGAVAAPPTLRPPGAPAWWIGAAIAVPVLLGIGAGLWVLGSSAVAGPAAPPPPAPPPPSTGSAAPPPAPSAAAPRPGAPHADPRRRPPSRSGR